MKRTYQMTLTCGAALLAVAAAFAQPLMPPNGPKFPNSAAVADTYKNVKRFGEDAPDPKRPAGGNTNTAHVIDNFVPVKDADLRNPDPANWMMMRGNYQDWGYSKLDQVNKGNVKNLQLAWARLMEPGANEATPIVYNGVMFLGNPNDVIQAIDAASGEVLWQYRRRLPSMDEMHVMQWGVTKRSVAVYDDKVYVTTRDNYLVALDARTGKEVWQVNRGGDYYVTNTTGPIVVSGVVLAGSQCQVAPFTCYVDAHDAETGKLLWRNDLIPHPGEPGDETWNKMPYNERWITDVWGPITYDPDLNIAYYGSSGIGPASEAQRHQVGFSLAGTDTRFAVNPQTGKILWQHQVLPEDNWDQDCTFEMMPIVTPVHPDPKAEGMFSVGQGVDGPSRKTLTGMPCKTGVLWSFDALTGQYLWSKSTVLQNMIRGIDQKGRVTINPDTTMRDINKSYRICPSYNGGRDSPMAAYSPQTNMIYAQLDNMCATVQVRTDNIPSMATHNYNTTNTPVVADGKTNIGRIDAINVETGKTAWSWETTTGNYASILATAGGLIFNGGFDRYFRAFDQVNGKQLWQTRLGTQVTGAPVSYSVKGRQYISVTTGGGGFNIFAAITPGLDQPAGANMVYVFALPQ